jgi:hypothetical protein
MTFRWRSQKQLRLFPSARGFLGNIRQGRLKNVAARVWNVVWPIAFVVVVVIFLAVEGSKNWFNLNRLLVRDTHDLTELTAWMVGMGALFLIYFVRRRVSKRSESLAGILTALFAIALALFLTSVLLQAYFAYSARRTSPWMLYLTGAAAIIWILWKGPALRLRKSKAELEPKDYLALETSMRTVLVQIVGGVLVLLGLYYTAQNLNLTQENVRLTLKKEESERLERASSLLKDDSIETRLVAIYNLRELSSESTDNYALVTDLLCGYIRAHAAWNDSQDQTAATKPQLARDIQAMLSCLTGNPLMRMRLNLSHLAEPSGLSFNKTSEIGSAIDLRGTDLRGANLIRAYLTDSILSSAHLDHAFLSNAWLDSAEFEGTVFADADLKGANFRRSDLKGAVFKNADLSNAFMSDADLDGADLSEAKNLTAEQVRQAKNWQRAKLPQNIAAALANTTPSP